MTDVTPPPRRPPGRPPSPDGPLRSVRLDLCDADIEALDRIARRDAGPRGLPSRTDAIRRMIRAEDKKIDTTNEGGQP